MAAFSEAVTINRVGGILTIKAIVDRVAQNNAIGGVVFNDASLVLTAINEDLSGCLLEKINWIMLRGERYQALEMIPDMISGLTTLKIKRFK